MRSPDRPSDADAVAAGHGESDDPRLQRWEQRFFWPVLLAAVASVPAMFLTVMLEGPPALAGEAINYASMAVFAAETVVLLLLAHDRRRWLREHWHVVAITAVTVPAVLLLLAPAQALRILVHAWRLVRFVGAFRIIRVGRILKAGKILYNRTSFSGSVRKAIAFGVTVLAAVFVALVLADPSAQSRRFLKDLLEQDLGDAWIVVVVLAGLLLAGATFVVARRRLTEERSAPDGRSREEPAESDPGAREGSASTRGATEPADAQRRT